MRKKKFENLNKTFLEKFNSKLKSMKNSFNKKSYIANNLINYCFHFF